MKLSRFEHNLDRQPALTECTWVELAAQLGDAWRAPCSAETCGKGEHEHVYIDKNGNERRGGCKHKYIGAWSPAVYPPGATRGKRSVEHVSALVVDLDHMTDAELQDVAERLAPYQYVAHATHGDRPDSRSIRAVLPLSEPVKGVDWPRFWPAVMRVLGLPADPQTCDASRLYFLPTRPSDLDYLFEQNVGIAVDVPAILAAAPVVPEVMQDRLSSVDVASPEKLAAAAHALALSWPAKGRHKTSLALCGALARVGWPAETIAAFVADVTRRADGGHGDGDYGKRCDQARDSIAKVHRREPVTGFGRLATELPALAPALERARDALGLADENAKLGAALDEAWSKKPRSTALADIFGPPSLSMLADDMPIIEPGSYLEFLAKAGEDVERYMGATSSAKDEQPFFLPGARLFTDAYPSTPWLVQGLIVEGGIGIIGGEPKAFKTWLGTEIALAVATGTDVVGSFKTKPGTVAYYYTEDLQVAVRNRVRALCAVRGLDVKRALDHFHFQPRGRDIDLTDDAACTRIIASCRMLGKVTLLVLDPLRNIHTGKENEADSMREVFRRATMIGMLVGCTVLIVHHSAKSTQDTKARAPGQRLRGSGAIHGFVDSGIYLEDTRGDETTVFTNTVRSQVKSARSAGTFELTLTVEDDSNGEAVRATWSKGAAGSTAPQIEEVTSWKDDAMLICGALLINEVKRLPPMNVNRIRDAVKRGMKTVQCALQVAQQSLWLTRTNKQQYELTEAGRKLAEDFNTGPAEREHVQDPSLAGIADHPIARPAE